MTSSPTLPPLYFQDTQGHSLTCDSDDNNTNNDETAIRLAPELLQSCCDFLNWGDLAKLACTQSSWRRTMYDAASATAQQWSLANAYLDGTDGLAEHPSQALTLLQQLVSVEIDPETKGPVYEETVVTDNASNETNGVNYVSMAAMKLAFLYLEQALPVRPATTTLTSTEIGMEWLKCAFYQTNSRDAAHELALIYEYGKYDSPTDVVAAAHWFRHAAEAGHVEAMAELGLCYELGCGVEASDEQALDWYIRAAQAGHTTAQFSVGEMFEEARGGVPQSDAEACLWYYRAAVEGDVDSRRALRRLEVIARIVVPGARSLLDE